MLRVYWPQLGQRQEVAGLSIVSDCSDSRVAHVTVIPNGSGAATVDIALLDALGAASVGTCNELQVIFPGKTTGGSILSEDTFAMPNVPEQFKKFADAGTRLTRMARIGGSDRLALSLAGAAPVSPVLRFLW